MQYSFTEYSADIEATRKGIHNTLAYNSLGMIGELGELVELLLKEVLPESTNGIEEEILLELAKFVQVASRIEALKKRTRKSQIAVLSDVSIPDEKGKLEEELGGVLWYLDTLSNNLKTNLGTAAFKNQEMLQKRFSHNPDWMVNGEKLH